MCVHVLHHPSLTLLYHSRVPGNRWIYVNRSRVVMIHYRCAMCARTPHHIPSTPCVTSCVADILPLFLIIIQPLYLPYFNFPVWWRTGSAPHFLFSYPFVCTVLSCMLYLPLYFPSTSSRIAPPPIHTFSIHHFTYTSSAVQRSAVQCSCVSHAHGSMAAVAVRVE